MCRLHSWGGCSWGGWYHGAVWVWRLAGCAIGGCGQRCPGSVEVHGAGVVLCVAGTEGVKPVGGLMPKIPAAVLYMKDAVAQSSSSISGVFRADMVAEGRSGYATSR